MGFQLILGYEGSKVVGKVVVVALVVVLLERLPLAVEDEMPEKQHTELRT